ncbi:hypothetical protein AMST5_01927 [freshwater sediment metagenome]|uniref:Uncharacterized protein n=1 Tax=freshwater sediment metagenome TaxID=556182 RepID=A0AA48R9P7_9ZZZZ
MPRKKIDRCTIHVVLPSELREWLREEATKSASCVSNEVTRALIAHRERVEDARAERAKKVA